MGLEMSKASPPIVLIDLKQTVCNGNIGYHGRMPAITFLGNRTSLFVAFLTCQSMGKS